jgi:hypothetical protein
MYDSAESAAQAGFPPGACRVVAARTNGSDAYVLLDTRPTGPPYLYGSVCYLKDGVWHEGSSGNGSGWSATGGDDDDDFGTLYLWNDAPAGANRVRISFRGLVHEEEVRDGAFLAVWWRVPFPEDEFPVVVAFRVDDRWMPSANDAPHLRLGPPDSNGP